MTRRQPWWLEWELWLLVLAASLIYLTRLNDAPLTGEEPRRGQVAREMIWSGDWIVPRQQGCLFLSRPPVQNWLIAAVGLVRGQIDAVAIRLPSGLAMLAVVVLVYGYCRTFLSRVGAVAAGASLATMGLVLQFGWLGETEALYMLLVGGSLLAWRWADATGRHPLWAWSIGYGLAALGMLTKGPQAPVYFIGGVGLFLVLSHRGRELFRWPHLAGLAIFLVGWAAWQVPYCVRVGSSDAWKMFSGDVTLRFHDAGGRAVLEHLAAFPLDVAICMLPWSVLLLNYARRDFRQTLGPVRDDMRFLACSIAVAFVSCWLAPGARNRYFAPLFPCFAPLIGLVVQRCFEDPGAAWANAWKHFLIGIGLLMPVVGTWVVAATVFGWGLDWGQQPLGFALGFGLATLVLCLTAFRAAGRQQPVWQATGIVCVTVFLGLSWTGVVMNVLATIPDPIARDVAELKRRLPKDVGLSSLGLVDCRFLYYYGEPIAWLPDGWTGAPPVAEGACFCMLNGPRGPRCDFPYEELALVLCHAEPMPQPSDYVVVARRLPSTCARRDK
jgi:4-amino-4-deoxy-L-arabinose transferase-like glycosyltransferase